MKGFWMGLIVGVLLATSGTILAQGWNQPQPNITDQLNSMQQYQTNSELQRYLQQQNSGVRPPC